MNEPQRCFSPDFQTARQRFCAAVLNAGGEISQLTNGTNKTDTDLIPDIAWFGPKNPSKAILVISGLHGVEGFAGAAIQLSVANQGFLLPDDMALVMIHIVNPYGMQNLRRVNHNNVDLNRNFQISGNNWQGSPEKYSVLDPFLNPEKAPGPDLFYLKLLLACARYGYRSIRQTIAEGQHDYPKGLFYGGSGLEPEAVSYLNWLKSSQLLNLDDLLVIDLHTGIGPFGDQSIFMRSSPMSAEELSLKISHPVTPNITGVQKALGYGHAGSNSDVLRDLFNGRNLTCLTVEYGTYSGHKLFYALRAENQQYHFGDGNLNHWAKQKLKEAFSPASHRWEERVTTQGTKLIRDAISSFAND